MIRRKNLESHFGRLLGHALGVGALTVASGALVAQAQEQTQATDQEQTLQTVIVTGSIIKRTDFETPSPVQVVTAEDLQQSGYTSVSDVLRNLSANGQGTLSQSFGLAFAGGGSGVALRGLTVGGTLTLFDSERMIPYPLSDDGQRNFVDITSIPFNVIERIDVLKDGASAEYGSDAIAGVVNVVLKRTFTGAQFTAEAGTSSHRDGTTEHLAGLWGIGDLGSDGYNAYFALEYRHQDDILLSNRTGLWTNLNWAPYGGADTRWGAYNPSENPFPGIPGGYVLNPATNVLDSTTHFLNPNACASYAAYEANQCVYQPGWQIQPQTGNLNALGRFTKNLGGDWQAVVTGSLFRSEAEQVGENNDPYPFINGLNPVSNVAYAPGVNPNVVVTPPITLPVGAPNNPFNAPAALVADFPQMGMVQTQFVTNTYRLFGDLKGTAAGWDLDGTLGWMYAALTQKLFGALNPGALSAAAADDFNFVTASPALMASTFAPEAEAKDTNTMEVVDFHGTRELMQLPGGALSVALGVGYYHLYKNSPAAPTVASGEQLGNGAYAIGGQSNDNAYVEFVAPVVKGLEIDVAGRYDHYNQYGSSTTPKFGVKYSPFRMLTLRGTYGQGFRAPNPAEAGESAALFGGLPFNDPVLCPTPSNPQAAGNFPNQCNRGVIGLQVSTPTLQPEKSRNYTAGFIFQPLDNTSVSFDYWDIKVNQDIQSGTSVFVLSGFNLNLFPITRGAPATLPYCVTTGNCSTLESTTIAGAGIGPVAYQAFPYFNATQTHVNGLDMDLLSHFDIGNAGRLTAQLNTSYMFHYIFGLQGSSFDLAGTHGPSIISGDTGNPKERATASLAWDVGSWNVTASLNYVGRFNLTDPTAGDDNCEEAIASGGLEAFNGRWPNGVPQSILNSYCEVKSFTDVDLYVRYDFSKNLSVHGSILNVFGQPPPIDLTTYGASGNDPYNPAMAQAGAVGRFFNIGATYTF
jgi:iron complex outermembrane recepter protein